MRSAGDTLVRPEALPSVDLLPPDVRERRRVAGLRRGLACGLVGLLALCVGGSVFALDQQQEAEDQLAVVEARSAELIAEHQRYAEVPQVLSRIDSLEAARAQVSAVEVLWQPYLGAIAATAPDRVSIDSLAVSVVSTFDGGTAATPGAPGTVVFTARSADLPDTADWVEGLAAVPGFSNPWISTASITESEGAVFYTVSGQVDIDPDAFAHRFDEEN